ncbi:hypothetical protein ACVW1A_004575 [Bradyrhizobium sp. LB1.3]
MFTLMHADVIRAQVFVPQDEALGVQPVSMQSSGSRRFPGERSRKGHADRHRVAARQS